MSATNRIDVYAEIYVHPHRDLDRIAHSQDWERFRDETERRSREIPARVTESDVTATKIAMASARNRGWNDGFVAGVVGGTVIASFLFLLVLALLGRLG